MVELNLLIYGYKTRHYIQALHFKDEKMVKTVIKDDMAINWDVEIV